MHASVSTIHNHYKLAIRIKSCHDIIWAIWMSSSLELKHITTYLERVDLFFAATEVPDDKKVAVLLSCIGPKTYSTLKNLTAPHLPGAKSLVELTAILKGHFDPKPSLIARFHFHRRKQRPDENIAAFMADLRRMATDCEFGATLDDGLRDHFISGLRSEAMHKHLLTEDKLTFPQALEISTGMEAIAQNVKGFQESDSS